MDANYLLELFNGTFQADPTVRGQAEDQLKQLSQHQPGFLGACLDILTETRVPAPIRKAAAVYLKNRVCMYWKPSDPFYKQFAIDHDEKPIVRDRIIDAIIGLDYQTKKQLIQVLHCLVQHDFEQWPGLTKQTGELLQETTLDNEALVLRLYTGLLCFLEICRHFRWQYNDDRDTQLVPIIELAFPHMLALGNALLEVPLTLMLEQLAEMLKLILKSYKFVTYIDFPAPLRQREHVAAWGEFHGKVLNYPTPSYVGDVDDKEKLMLEISKCYKWSVANMYRLFSRYGLVLPLKKFNYREFYTMFADEFVPHLLNNYLLIVSSWCNGDRWLSDTTLYQLLQFFSHLVAQKNTWNQMKPTIDQLVGHVIWPLVCPNDSQLEMFEEDPQEYIHLYFDFNERSDLPSVAALGFLQTLVKKRRSYTMEPIIKFGHAQLTALGAEDGDLESAKKKEGIFTMLGSVSHVVIPQYNAQMEQFLSQLVFPALTLKYGFLKARAIEVALKYAEVNFTDENTLKGLFHGILSNFHDQLELPVSFCATLAIQSYLGHPQFTPILRNIIVRVMLRLLEISNQIDNDVTLIVMQECVENFSEQLQGYGVDLMQKLVEQFMRLARDVADQQNQDFDDANYDEAGDKVIAATGLLGTMITILLSFENSREICLKLEEVMAPAIEYCLANELDDFLGEIAQLIENLTYLLQMVSPTTWKHFPGLVKCFQSRIALLYLDNLIPCLHNYLVYGSDTIRANPELVAQFYLVFALIAADEDDLEDDFGRQDEYIYACELSQTFVMKLKEVAKPYIPQFLQAVYHIGRGLDEQDDVYTLMGVNVTDVIIACLVVDPEVTLMHLSQAGQAETFFSRWFKVIPKLQRVFDLKLTALGLVTLYNSSLSLPKPIVDQLGTHLATVVKALPAAITNLEKRKQEFDAYDVGDANYKFTAEDWSEHEWDELIDDAGDATEGAADVNFSEFLASEEIKLLGFFDKAHEEPIEDPLASLALDDVDVVAVVRDFIQLETGQQALALMSDADRLALLA